MENSTNEHDWINNSYADSEVVIGLVGAVGTDLTQVSNIIKRTFRSSEKEFFELI